MGKRSFRPWNQRGRFNMARRILTIERAFPVSSQGLEPDILFRLVVLPVPVVAPAPLGGADMDPARCPVDRAGISRGLYERLDEHGRGVVALGPVVGQAPADEGEDVRTQVGDPDPGRDQDPRVVDHEREVLLAQLRRPSDEVVARGELPGGGGEAEHGDGPAVAVVDGVAHLGADQGPVAEIVVAGDELVPQPSLAGAVHDGAHLQRADLVEGCRGREQRRLGVGSEDDRLRPVLPPLRQRQGDHAVAVHGEHGDPGHHVLEPAVGLEPADAAAELSRQGGAGGLRIGGDQGVQQRHLVCGEVAPVIAALDHAGHPGAMNSRLRFSLMDHGSQGDRSSGGWRPFFAQASSHASSQRSTSMPFIESVPATEYTIAVNLAPSSLFEPKLNRLPMTGPRSTRSARLLSIGTWGRSTKALSPSRWLRSERSALPSRASSGRAANSRWASANRASSASFSAVCVASNAGAGRLSPESQCSSRASFRR